MLIYYLNYEHVIKYNISRFQGLYCVLRILYSLVFMYVFIVRWEYVIHMAMKKILKSTIFISLHLLRSKYVTKVTYNNIKLTTEYVLITYYIYKISKWKFFRIHILTLILQLITSFKEI